MTRECPPPELEHALLERRAKREGSELRFLCPAHSDHAPSARYHPTKHVWHCDVCKAGGGWKDLAERLGLLPARRGGGGASSPRKRRNAATGGGLTVAQYAEAKRLPVAFLEGLGLSTIPNYLGAPAVRIPYRGPEGEESEVQFRTALSGANRLRWRSGSKPIPYGLDRLSEARERGEVVLVEGPSDAQTLWHHGELALGLPGTHWREEWAVHLEGVERVYAVIEPDQGGEALQRSLSGSALAGRVHLVRLAGAKDVSEAHVADRFRRAWERALKTAEPLAGVLRREREEARAEAWEECAALARAPRVLEPFARDLRRLGVVGEERAAKLLYLVLTSRLLERIVSAAVKGPSSAGKSRLTEAVLEFFPSSAAYRLSGMSERLLAYDSEPLSHRVLVLAEAAGLGGDFASFLVRTLLSEGRLRYGTVEKTRDGLRPKTLEREGPTGLLVTTTRVSLHPENETRLFSIPVNDSRQQTRAVLLALADEVESPVDLGSWLALQRWLELGERRVVLPFARELAELTPPVAVRLRRDFGALLNLVRAHALLHQASRERDAEGRTVATLEDYSAVRSLVVDLIGQGVEVSVSRAVRETVAAVRELAGEGSGGVSAAAVARALEVDRSTAVRRVRVALAGGYLTNLEDRRGRPMRLVPGDEPLPEEQEVLPTPERLAECEVLNQDEVPL